MCTVGVVLLIILAFRIQPVSTSCSWPTTNDLPTYWINLEESLARRTDFSAYLKSINFVNNKRVDAVNCKKKNTYTFSQHVVSSTEPNEVCDYAVIGSHLSALYSAVTYQKRFSHPYAIIAEDDIRFLYCIDFHKLIESAPPDFGVLQLATSNIDSISRLWDRFTQNKSVSVWEPREDNRAWGAQIYIVNTRRIKKLIRASIDLDALRNKSLFSYHLYPPQSLLRYCNTSKDLPGHLYDPLRMLPALPMKYEHWHDSHCSLSFRFYVETFIYESMYPAYVSRISLVVGSSQSKNSTLHQVHVEKIHGESFRKIVNISEEFRANNDQVRMPSFLLGTTDYKYNRRRKY